jgi:hypothetical protein
LPKEASKLILERLLDKLFDMDVGLLDGCWFVFADEAFHLLSEVVILFGIEFT